MTILVKEQKNYSSTAKKILKHLPMYIILGIFALVVILPIGWAILSSFKTSAEIQTKPFHFPAVLQFVNYYNAWVAADMGKFFLNSIMLTFGALVVLILLAVPTAYVLSRFSFRFRKFLTVYIMAGLFINVSYIVLPVFLMMNDIGKAIFGDGTLLTDNPLTVILLNAVTAVPFSIYLLSGFLSTMPKGFEEAAKIDGCGYVGTLVKIVLPLALPSVLTIVLFNFLAFWNEYLVSLTFLTGDTFRPLPVGLLRLMEQSKTETDYGRMFAGLVIVMLPVLIVYVFVQGQLTKGMTVGGIKG